VRLTTGADAHTATVSSNGSLMAYSQLRFRANLYEIMLPESGTASIRDARPITRQNHLVENHHRTAAGRLLVYDSDITGNQEIYLVDRTDGEPRAITSNPAQDMDPMFSPDGSEIVFYSNRNGSRDLYLVSIEGGAEVRLTGREEDGWAAGNHEMLPFFSPDGLHITFMSSPLGFNAVHQLMIMSRDSIGGAWTPARLLADSLFTWHDWSPDGRYLVMDHANGFDVVSLDGERSPLIESWTMTTGAWVLWADDGRIYIQGSPPGGAAGIYAVDMSSGRVRDANPELVIRFDEPGLVNGGYPATLVGNSMVLTVDEKEADVFLMDLEY